MDADLKSSELASKGESGFPMTGRVSFDSGSADGVVASGSPAKSSLMGESPVGLPSRHWAKWSTPDLRPARTGESTPGRDLIVDMKGLLRMGGEQRSRP